ncbi:MAG: hypothetical protein QM723_17225 [Myxococcaceae bacterium]
MRQLFVGVVLLASAAFGADREFRFQSIEDPAFPPDPNICAQAPFAVNVKLGASLWSDRTRRRDGKVVDEQVKQIGKATACVQLTNFLFPPGLQQNFYAQFDLPQGSYVVNGTCTLISNSVPQAGLVLAGCNLAIVSGPPDTLKGAFTSLSTFNPLKLSGFNTGSMWTVLEYFTPPPPHHGHDGDCDGDDDDDVHHDRPSHHSFNVTDDGRTNEQIEAARNALESKR